MYTYRQLATGVYPNIPYGNIGLHGYHGVPGAGAPVKNRQANCPCCNVKNDLYTSFHCEKCDKFTCQDCLLSQSYDCTATLNCRNCIQEKAAQERKNEKNGNRGEISGE